jgi:hypothetical protein
VVVATDRRLQDEATGLQASVAELRQVRPQVCLVKAELAAVAQARRQRAGRGVVDMGHR